MRFKLLILLFYSGYFTIAGVAQHPDIEFLLEQQNEYSDVSDLLDLLEELEENPINLNHATVEQFTVLPWISDILAVAIVNYRNQVGGFKTIEELVQVKNFDPELLPIFRQYFYISTVKGENHFSVTTKNRYSRKIEQNEGLKNGIYYPSPAKIYNRYMLTYRNSINLGILLEKDTGEQQIDDLKLYFLKYYTPSEKIKLIIGNFRLEFGQGLIFGNPYSYYKGSTPIYPAKRRGRGILQYTLVDENASLYGIAGQVCLKIYQFSFFLSSAKLDATVNPDQSVKNFYRTGYHRNPLELNKKDRLTEQLVGGRLCLNPSLHFSMGITYYQSLFDRLGVIQNENDDKFSQNTKINELIGFDYNLTLGHFNFFGEAARSKNRENGLVAGILTEVNPLKLLILVRNYSKDFISLHGNSFGEHSYSPQNERGIYFGFQINPLYNLKFSVYFDQFKHHWRTYFVPMPSTGKDLFFRIEHHPMKKLLFYLQVKSSQKDNYISNYKMITPRNRNNLRLQVEYQPWDFIKLRQRFEKSWVNYKIILPQVIDKYEGILIYQDLNIQLNTYFKLAARITFFDTDLQEIRLYQFEQAVPGMMTNTMLNGIGNRWYLFIQWKLKSILTFSLKFGSTQYYRDNSIASNADEVLGDTLNSINLQLDVNLLF